MSKRIIYLFRNDLRVQDNEAFLSAAGKAEEILPLYVFDTRKFMPTPLGFRQTGVFRAAFVIECVRNLREKLRKTGADLIIRSGEPEQVAAAMARDLDASEIYMSKEIAFEETNMESSLSKRLKVINVDIEMIWMSTLCHPHDLPFWVSRLPGTFGAFREAISRDWKVRELLPVSETVRLLPGFPAGEIPSLGDLGFTAAEIGAVDTTRISRLASASFTGDFFASLPGEDGTEEWLLALSAGLAAGLLSPRQAYTEIVRAAAREKKPQFADSRISELIWRDYLQFTALRYGPRIFKLSGIRQDVNRRWKRDRAAFEKWCLGATGNREVDRIMTILNQTGAIPEQSKREAAAYLAEEMNVAWTWGASYFESLLLDYDVCSTWGSWNYYSGVGWQDPPERPGHS